MLTKIKKILEPPVFEDEEKTRVARMLNVVLLAIILLMGMLTVVRGINGDFLFGESTVFSISLFLVAIILQFIMRRGYVQATGILLITLSWIALTFQAWSADGIRDAAFIAYIVIVLLANLLLGWQAGIIFLGLSILAAWGFAYAEDVRLIQVKADKPYSLALDLTVIFSLSAVAMALTITGLSNALKRVGSSEQSLVEGNQKLQELSESLEQQVAIRTRRLETLTSLSEHFSAILDQERLLVEVVNQIKNNFGYYHAHIYLLDEATQKLVVTAGTGQAGAEMKASGHNIAVDAPTSLVARAARSANIVTVDNVREAKDWLPNRLLPDTYSEMAVPIVLEESVVGVLDVQEDEVAGFDEGDAALLRSLANQIAVSIHNARLFAEVEAALADARKAQEVYLEQSWQKPEITSRGKYTFADPNAGALDEARAKMLADAKKKMLQQQKPIELTTDAGADEKLLSIPVNLQNKTIGALQLHTSDKEEWDEDELALVEAVADQLSQTAENLRLFEDTRGLARREQIIRQVTEKMQAATSMEELIQTTAKELGQQLNAGHVVLDLGLTTGEEI